MHCATLPNLVNTAEFKLNYTGVEPRLWKLSPLSITTEIIPVRNFHLLLGQMKNRGFCNRL